MKNKTLTILTILICLETNLYWYVHRATYPELFLRINSTIALLLIMIVPIIQQRLKNDKKESI